VRHSSAPQRKQAKLSPPYQCHTQQTDRTAALYSKGEPKNLLVVYCGVKCFSKDIVIINKGTEVLHSFVDLQRVLPASCSDVSFFQGESELMDIKVEEVTVIKEEEEGEDRLSVTCPALKHEKEVSCLCVSTVT
jgi:hypothetical protein